MSTNTGGASAFSMMDAVTSKLQQTFRDDKLKPPKSTEQMMKETDATSVMYDKNVQKTYG